ncbi:hypothetical protein AQJ91_18830 [Streptomyces dysideae]|uniref:Uncharacterized protein n=1 Tax=Streptomyces dysideae TaxID=909626 RepID=A0A117S0B6_9ACTN|nr:hypothetical protein AQJ91_18830 [Streptomyces dysideae]
MFLQGGLGQDQAFGDLGVRPALGDGRQDFVLAVAQGAQPRVGLEDPCGNARPQGTEGPGAARILA